MIDLPTSYQLVHRSLPEILKFRLILHMVKDDWPHPIWQPRIYQKFLSLDLGYTWSKMMDPLNQLPQDFTRNFKVKN